MSWRDSGVVTGVQIDPGPGCASAEALQFLIFPLGEPPALPIGGCTRKPCCACCYSAVLEDEDRS